MRRYPGHTKGFYVCCESKLSGHEVDLFRFGLLEKTHIRSWRASFESSRRPTSFNDLPIVFGTRM
jgi:hypothetical protein